MHNRWSKSMTDTTTYVEKRKTKRVTVACEMEVWNQDEDYRLVGLCCNYSDDGILFKVDELLRVDTPVRIVLDYNHHSIDKLGKVVRTVKSEKLYLTAVSFT